MLLGNAPGRTLSLEDIKVALCCVTSFVTGGIVICSTYKFELNLLQFVNCGFQINVDS